VAESLKGFQPKKRFGQNFLSDHNILNDIVEAAQLKPEDTVLEIGPGKGALTDIIAKKCRTVSVEIDRELVPFLRERFSPNKNVSIVEGDILASDLRALVPPGAKVIANIPYYISTPIIFRLLEEPGLFSVVVMTVQKELADRIAAEHGNKDYGVLTVMVKLRADVTVVRQIPAAAFKPAPDVDSAVIRLVMHGTPEYGGAGLHELGRIVKAGFQQRRKMLRGTLQNIGYSKETVEKALKTCGIKPEARPEEISVEGFIALGGVLAGKK
jgi:16S rRNA (adenine1518-N6/adenine1519-N6)-dimethyltransferase